MEFILNILNLSSHLKHVCAWFRKPKIEQAYASIAIGHPNTKTCSGKFLITNPGPRICNIMKIELQSEIPLPKLNLAAIGQWPGDSVTKNHTQKLPMSLPIDEPKWVFFRTEGVAEVYKGDLPETIVMEILLDRIKKPIKKTLKKESNGHQYNEEYREQ